MLKGKDRELARVTEGQDSRSFFVQELIMQIVYVKDLSCLIAEGLVPVHPLQVVERLTPITGADTKVEVVPSPGTHHQTVWVSRVNADGSVEVCSVHMYCEVTTPHEPFLWRFSAFEALGATLRRVEVCVALVRGPDALREPSSQQLYREMFSDVPTATSLLKLDLSPTKVSELAQLVLGAALELAPT